MTDEFEEKALVQATTKPDGPQCDHLIWEAKAREIVEDRRTGQRGMWIDTSGMVKLIATALAEAVAAERESCAKIADARSDSPSDHEAGCAISIADAIRARSQGDVSTQSVRGDALCDHPGTSEDKQYILGPNGDKREVLGSVGQIPYVASRYWVTDNWADVYEFFQQNPASDIYAPPPSQGDRTPVPSAQVIALNATTASGETLSSENAALRSRIEALETALAPFVYIADATELVCREEGTTPEELLAGPGLVVATTYADCRRARAALHGTTSGDRTPNATTIAAMEEADRGDLPRFSTVAELMEHLESDEPDEGDRNGQ